MPGIDDIGRLKTLTTRGMSIMQAVCASSMGASTTAILLTDLAGYSEDYFNGGYFSMMVIKNANSAGNAPEHEIRLITDYASSTGTFTTEAFSANVEASDIVLIISSPTRAGISAIGAVSDAGAAITDFDTNLVEATNDHYNGMLLMFIGGANMGQAHVIDDYVGASKNVSFATDDQWTDVPANGDRFVIIPAPGKYLKKTFAGSWNCVIPNIDVSLAAIDNALVTDPSAGAPDVENTIMDLAITAGTMYRIDDLVLKVSAYGTGVAITIKVWELLGGSARANYVTTRTLIVPTDYPITTYLGLMELVGKPTIVGDGIAMTATTDAGNTGALSCTYTYSTAKTA